MKNVILSFASTYSYYELQPFVESWKENASEVDFYLFYIDISEWTRTCLEAAGVNLIKAPNEYKNDFFNQHGNVMYMRMHMFNEFLKKHLHEYHSVLVSDIRDVIIQKGLFSDVPQGEYLRFSMEGAAIVNNAVNAGWITRLTGNEKWKNQFGNEQIINAGVYSGSLSEIVRFHETLFNMQTEDLFWGADQASINVAVYSGLLKNQNNIIADYPDKGSIISIYFNRKGYRIEKGLIVNEYGEAPSVVHQYDRASVLVDFVNAQYRKKYIMDVAGCVDFRSSLEKIRAYIYWGKYQEALTTSFMLEKNTSELYVLSLTIPIIKDVLYQCNVRKNKDVILFIAQLVRKHAIQLFSGMSVEDKKTYLDMYLDWINDKRFINCDDEDEFVHSVWDLLQCNVNEKNWSEAYNIIGSVGWRMRNIGSAFYLVAAEIYRNLNMVDKSLFLYKIACNRQCTPIYYLETNFQSPIIIKDNYLQHTRVGNIRGIIDDVITEDMMNFYPLCFCKKMQGCILFLFVNGKYLYVQQIKDDGSVSLGTSPNIFNVKYINEDVVSIKISDDEYLSARPNGKFIFINCSKPWEHFKLIPCNVTKLYSLMERKVNN